MRYRRIHCEGVPFFGVALERDEKMLRGGWMAIDTEGEIMGCGVLGMGHRFEAERQKGSPLRIMARVRAGVDAYDAIKASAPC